MISRYMEIGGMMMWPLALCSVMLGAVLFERVWTVVFCRAILRLNIPARRLMSHRVVLRFFTDIPPALGLLGTVIGVVRSFQLTEGRISAESAAAGLGVACFTTIAGLCISIAASVASYLLDWLAGSQARAAMSNTAITEHANP